jgi:hypothetical protein
MELYKCINYLEKIINANYHIIKDSDNSAIQENIDYVILFINQIVNSFANFVDNNSKDFGIINVMLLTGLSLVHHDWLENGPAYAMASLSVRTQTLSDEAQNINLSQINDLINLFKVWITIIENFPSNYEKDYQNILNILFRFEETKDTLLQSLTLPNYKF